MRDECVGHRGVAVAHHAVIACEVEWCVDVARRLVGRVQAVEAFVVSHVGDVPDGPAFGLDGRPIEHQPARPLVHQDAAQGTQDAVQRHPERGTRDHGVDAGGHASLCRRAGEPNASMQSAYQSDCRGRATQEWLLDCL